MKWRAMTMETTRSLTIDRRIFLGRTGFFSISITNELHETNTIFFLGRTGFYRLLTTNNDKFYWNIYKDQSFCKISIRTRNVMVSKTGGGLPQEIMG